MNFVKTLLGISLAASAMIGAALAVRALFARKLHPAVMLCLWALVLLRLCLPFTLESPVRLAELLPKAPAIQTPTPQAVAPKAASVPHTKPLADSLNAAPASPTTVFTHQAASPKAIDAPTFIETITSLICRISIWDTLPAAWALGALAVLASAIWKARRFRRKLRLCKPVENEAVLASIAKHRLTMGIRKEITALECGFVSVPMVLGQTKPRILLPIGFIQMDSRTLEGILLHELCHIKRSDLLAGYAWLAAKAVHWFNPMVWLAWHAYQSDVELCCDDMAVRVLGLASRLDYGQALVAAGRHLQRARSPLPASAMPFLRTSGLSERVRRVVMPARRSKASAPAAVALSLLMLLACFTTACQPTPSEPSVANKGNAQLDDKLKATATPGVKAGISGRHTASFPGADASVTVSIDAAVDMPQGNLPVIEVKPRVITMQQVKAMTNVLFQGAKAYEPADMTKAGIQDEIVRLRRKIADNASMLSYYDGDQQAVDLAVKEYQKQLASYEAMLPSAPDAAAQKETDWTFHPDSYYTGAQDAGNSSEDQYFIATGMIGDYHTFIQAGNTVKEDYESHFAGFTLGKDIWESSPLPKWRYAEDKPGNMTRNEAVALAKETLGQMGLGSMRLASCKAEQSPKITSQELSQREALNLVASYAPRATEPPEGQACSYYLTFVPVFEGVPLLETGRSIEQDQYGPPYSYESLHIRVRDGLVTDLDWKAPLEAVRVENASVAILPFEEAVNAFQKQMQLAYTLESLASATLENNAFSQYKGKLDSGRIQITDIRLGLMRIRVKDKPNAYRLVPAWMFSGSEELQVKGIDAPLAGLRSETGLYAYAVINAVDGSIIDPTLGY